jgi:hypothetical protein
LASDSIGVKFWNISEEIKVKMRSILRLIQLVDCLSE